MKFKVNVLNSSQKTKTFIEYAESEKELKKKLQAQQYFLVDYKILEEKSLEKKSVVILKKKDVINFTYQIWLLLKAGVNLIDAIEELKSFSFSDDFKKVVIDLYKSINSGNKISDFLKNYPETFNEYYIGLINAGEMSGSLTDSFYKIYQILEHQNTLRNKIISIAVYPLILVFMSFIFFIFMMSNVLPNITLIFKELNSELPILTQWIINFSEFFNGNRIKIFSFAAVLLICFRIVQKKNFFKKFFEKIKINLPFIKNIYLSYIIINFSQVLSVLLEKNVPLAISLEISLNATNSIFIKSRKVELLKKFKAGEKLAKVLKELNFFPNVVIKLINTGEKSNNLKSVFENINFVYNEKLENTLKIVTSIIESVIMLILGIVITIMVLAILLPIMKLKV